LEVRIGTRHVFAKIHHRTGQDDAHLIPSMLSVNFRSVDLTKTFTWAMRAH
jgi:hypothetical protein